jgi:hypothetical protein
MPQSIIRNRSNAPVECKISNDSNVVGGDISTQWQNLTAGTGNNWNRTGEEYIYFGKRDTNNQIQGLGRTLVNLTDPKLVEFHDRDKIVVF